MKEDISNMEYDKFLEIYESIIAKSCKLLKQGELACFVVGEFMDKKDIFTALFRTLLTPLKNAV